jgi:PLP dependent protein
VSPLQERYLRVQKDIASIAEGCGRDPKTITLVVVSKKQSVEEIQALYEMGCRHFGESRLEEVLDKKLHLPKDIFWHMIGTIQSKKVPKLVVAGFFLIHSVDSMALAEKISKKSAELECVTKVLLQANTSGEETKHGLSVEEWKSHYHEVVSLPALQIEGWMTMAPLTEDKAKIVASFHSLRDLRDRLTPSQHLSMGMSHDYPLAIQEGATLLRIGSSIFRK